MTDEEILKISNKDDFPAQFNKYREFLKIKIANLEFLAMERNRINKDEDPEGFKHYLDLADEINEIIRDEEQKFMAKNGDILKLIENWVEVNPNTKAG